MAIDDVGPTRTFGNISLADQGAGTGALQLSREGFGWRARDSGRQITVATSEIIGLKWLRGGRGHQIRVKIRGGSSVMFEGFHERDRESLAEFFSSTLERDLQRANQALRGWSFGNLSFVSGGAPSLNFKTGGFETPKGRNVPHDDAFEVPIASVANVQLPYKNELALDINVDDTAGKMDEELVEVRFYLPDEEEADKLLNQVKARADTSAFAGETICSFQDVAIVVPRGRFEVDLFPNYIKLHGKTVDFKILYSSITRLFLLPKPDDTWVAFVMSLEPPIRQGNTMYPHIVVQFRADDYAEVDLAISEAELKKRYGGKLAQRETGEVWKVFSRIVKNLSKTLLHVPKTFKTTKDTYAVRTALGANEGFLFFLESCCFFVNKPPTCVRYDDIDLVEFKRLDLERRFDLVIQQSNGHSLLFTNIERTEFSVILNFLDGKQVPIDNIEHLRRSGSRAGQIDLAIQSDDDSEESDDEDFDPDAAPTAEGADDGPRGKDAPSGSRRAPTPEPAEDEDESDEDDMEFDEGSDADAADEVMDLVKDAGDVPAPKKRRRG